MANFPGLWETVRMSEKRTKTDKAQRQADQLEKKSSHRPAQSQKSRVTPWGMPPPFMLTAADHPKVTLNGLQE
jgi:hypothetical protein